MKFLKQKLLGGLLILATPALLSAQVKFKIDYNTDADRYAVSIVPEQTLTFPHNLTGTGQVSIKVPAGAFELAEYENANPAFLWEMNSQTDSPEEAMEYDYLSFGLISQGTDKVEYVKDQEMVLFTFRNGLGCQGAIELVDNATDVFMAPNSRNVNVGNQLAILGASMSSYGGIVGTGVAECDPPVVEVELPGSPTGITAHENKTVGDFTLFPNPTVDVVNVSFDWEAESESVDILVLDEAGKELLKLPHTLAAGDNTLKITVDHLPGGAYLLSLRGNGWSNAMGHFVKE